jgi:nucleotide-binding universal stress UspA family protein
MKRIVIGLEGRARDRQVVAWVADYATDDRASFIAVHAVPRATIWMLAGAQTNSDAYLNELRVSFDFDVLAPLHALDCSVRLEVRVGDPAHELAATAQRWLADAIVIGGGDHGVLHDVVFGNLERRLVRLSDVPVITIPCHSRRPSISGSAARP